ncbi:hypothetical protein [Corynebacterium argentoratense]|uniref:hypothetical protein n=1 Tax=Corynebacterium argentoratense TaxID=42817 RepID=UPI001F3BBF94|nr:hypothetical protein [Corynebacterium argentoratense]MCF1694324.1 hypothetical protein [Corynebacterium argentoratense]MCF1735895.1 hypothetical protein [Corynebacterium argentoratense]
MAKIADFTTQISGVFVDDEDYRRTGRVWAEITTDGGHLELPVTGDYATLRDRLDASVTAAASSEKKAKASEGAAAGSASAAKASESVVLDSAAAAAGSAARAEELAGEAAASSSAAGQSAGSALSYKDAAERLKVAVNSRASAAEAAAKRAEAAANEKLVRGGVKREHLSSEVEGMFAEVRRQVIDELRDGASSDLDTFKELAAKFKVSDSQFAAITKGLAAKLEASKVSDSADAETGTVVARSGRGQISVAAPGADAHATPRRYVDEAVRRVQSAVDSKVSNADPRLWDERAPRAHKHSVSDLVDAPAWVVEGDVASDATGGKVVKRDGGGHAYAAHPTEERERNEPKTLATVQWVREKLAGQKTADHVDWPKNIKPPMFLPVGLSTACRLPDGQLQVKETPTNKDHAASKKYVDDVAASSTPIVKQVGKWRFAKIGSVVIATLTQSATPYSIDNNGAGNSSAQIPAGFEPTEQDLYVFAAPHREKGKSNIEIRVRSQQEILLQTYHGNAGTVQPGVSITWIKG